jgi:hypothetical protein
VLKNTGTSRSRDVKGHPAKRTHRHDTDESNKDFQTKKHSVHALGVWSEVDMFARERLAPLVADPAIIPRSLRLRAQTASCSTSHSAFPRSECAAFTTARRSASCLDACSLPKRPTPLLLQITQSQQLLRFRSIAALDGNFTSGNRDWSTR